MASVALAEILMSSPSAFAEATMGLWFLRIPVVSRIEATTPMILSSMSLLAMRE